MGFRFRLASFFVAALVIVQALTAVLVYEVTRRELIGEGQRQLGVASTAFARQLDDLSGRVAANVQVLALDFALRSAIAQRDQATVLSALRNHGRRVGAARMLLVGTDGKIEADTSTTADTEKNFPYDDLLQRSFEKPAAALVAENGRAYWMVVVPVFAPTLVGEIAAAIPVDDSLLSRLQAQSTLPKSVELATAAGNGGWTVVAHGQDHVAMTAGLATVGHGLPYQPELVDVGGREYVAQAVRLNGSKQSAAVVAVLGYSVDEALSPYRSVARAWAALLAFGLAVGLCGAWLIARGVSRPVEQLAASARRIEAGDYRLDDIGAPQPAVRRDEIGQLASAFANMARAIGEREAQIRHQAGHDQVTGLFNRVAAETAIQRELHSHTERPAALLMIGLGRIPEIIKTLGHAVSDRLMRDTAGRILRLVDDALIARATDTQFSIFLPACAKPEAIATAFRVLDALSAPYQEADLTLDLVPAVGIALYPAHGAEASALLRRAEVALLAALGSEEPVVVYDPATDPHRPERLSLMGDLREALDHDQLSLHYQPKLLLSDARIIGAEGLVRWQHPRLGMVPPDAFIAMAEETGNIRRLTRWALAAGIAQAHRWSTASTAIRVSINLSARDLDDADLPRRIAELLSIHKVPPERIMLEVTESAVMGKPDAAIGVMRRLADQGIDLSIDDFGVGQSSFAYLRRLPVRELKIDKTFVQHLTESQEDRTIVGSIVDLGHKLGYKVTAEGVESRATLDWLAQIGCDYAQGYFIAKPMPVDAFDRFVANDAARALSGNPA
ncbi:MAG TPA: EAL domain-containing protein [Xanthomonadaceae bacterium]|nr:EAL domain-containing protein [Xanthomonadaceae bacterium]